VTEPPLRARFLRSAPVLTARTAAFAALRPVYRRAFDGLGTPAQLRRAVRFAVPGGTHQVAEEIEGFMAYAAARRPRRVCEIGVADGGTTVLLSRMSPTVEVMIGIDLRIAHRRILEGLAPAHQRLHLLEASSLEDTTVARARELLGGEPLDLLFIDGSHTYDDALSDFEQYRGLVRPGGLIAFHDIVPDYGERFGRPTPYWSGGVPRLWSELRERHPHREFVRDPEQDAFGIGVLEYEPG